MKIKVMIMILKCGKLFFCIKIILFACLNQYYLMYYSCCFVFLKTGEQSEPPTQAILEKQRLVLEGLREKLELNISNVDKLPAAELQQVVDKAVNQVSSMIIYQLFRNEMSLELLFQTYNLT